MDIISKLESTRDQTLQYFDLGDDDLAKTYGPDKWPVRFVLLHIADSETVLSERIRRTLSETRPVLWAFDPDQWAAGLDYSQLPLDLSRRIYDATRAGIIHLARQYYEIYGTREFVHSETGVRTLKQEFDKVADHNAHHLAQIEMALTPKH
jgi:hypothetical protein